MLAVRQRPGSLLELCLAVADLLGDALDANVIGCRFTRRRSGGKAECCVAGQRMQCFELPQREWRQVDIPANARLGVLCWDKPPAGLQIHVLPAGHQQFPDTAERDRDQLRDFTRLMAKLVPMIIALMMDNPNAWWGEAVYPVIDRPG